MWRKHLFPRTSNFFSHLRLRSAICFCSLGRRQKRRVSGLGVKICVLGHNVYSVHLSTSSLWDASAFLSFSSSFTRFLTFKTKKKVSQERFKQLSLMNISLIKFILTNMRNTTHILNTPGMEHTIL